jgi:signal transduction histidine kinase
MNELTNRNEEAVLVVRGVITSMTNASGKSQALEELPGGRHGDRTFPSLLGLASSDPVDLVREDDGESKDSRGALKELCRRLIKAQEDDRGRFADKLCDLNQSMALLSAGLDDLRQVKNQYDIESRVESLQEQMREISLDLQQLSYKLYPLKVAYLGLPVALESLCRELSTTGEFNVVFQQSEFGGQLPDEIKLCIFRIAEEALQNCMKHSGARSALVQLRNTGKEVRLVVGDEGCGFEVNAEQMKLGHVLTSMCARVRAIGGKMTIRSRRCEGTLIEVLAPHR